VLEGQIAIVDRVAAVGLIVLSARPSRQKAAAEGADVRLVTGTLCTAASAKENGGGDALPGGHRVRTDVTGPPRQGSPGGWPAGCVEAVSARRGHGQQRGGQGPARFSTSDRPTGTGRDRRQNL